MEDQQLQKMVALAQQEILSVNTNANACKQLINLMLRSRKIGRPPLGQSLTGIHQHIYQSLHQQLTALLPTALKAISESALTEPLSLWTQRLLSQATQQILTDDMLKSLALEAQRQPKNSASRRHTLVQLIEAIRIYGRLAKPHRTKFSPQFYDLLYEDALNQTFAYVCRKIDTYDPDRGKKQKFMNWVNFRLDKMIIECRRAFGDRDTQALPNLNDLDRLPQPEPDDSLADTVRDYIRADPEHLFTQTHIRNRPDASFQVIALARFSGQSWEALATQFEIKIPTLSSFFQRCCQKFSPQFQTLL
ncbi:MAG: hypothetical protein AAFZ17_06230 [Cyanobacteria bacterium J06650_10]